MYKEKDWRRGVLSTQEERKLKYLSFFEKKNYVPANGMDWLQSG